MIVCKYFNISLISEIKIFSCQFVKEDYQCVFVKYMFIRKIHIYTYKINVGIENMFTKAFKSDDTTNIPLLYLFE